MQPTFEYDSHWWENDQTLNVDEGVERNQPEVETKLASYSNTPFTKICLGMRVGDAPSQTNWIGIDYQATSLYSLIADGEFRVVNIKAQIPSLWQTLIDESHLPVQCLFQGFNVPSKIHSTMNRVRLGYLAHKRCHQQEGLIGFGTNLDGVQWSSGYIYPSREGDPKKISAFGYIFVR